MDIEGKFVHPEFIREELVYSEVYYYLDRYMDQEIFTVSDLKGNPAVKQNHVIWVLWLLGMENAPKLVQKCYESVCRNKPEDFEVVLLSKKNLDQYIHLPDYVLKKHEEGSLSYTHLSDIIRLELLCTYGGCWIDATVYCSGAIPRYMVSRDAFMFKASRMDDPVLKMSSWWLASDKNNRLMHATRKVWYRFWEQENSVRNYYLIHIIMSKIIDEDTACNIIFRNIPSFNNENPHVLFGKLGMEFDEEEWEIIKDISTVHKLSYKRRYLQGDIYNYYMALMDGKLV